MMELWKNMASLIGVVVLFERQLSRLIPYELRLMLLELFQRLFNSFNSYYYFDIAEIDGINVNELYTAVQLYLSESAAANSTTSNRLSITRGLNSSVITFGLTNNARLSDVFQNVKVVWEHVVTPRQSGGSSSGRDKRRFTLRVSKKDKPRILNDYLEFITEKAKEIKRKNRDRFLYTNNGTRYWDNWVPFKHPCTFETLAMDPVKKAEIMSDLRDFKDGGKAFYERTGRAWKRGYLLYGPPGTGKSSMIAAMANYLNYDIFDLELTGVKTNSDLRKLLISTTSKSIIVIEDIDCSVNFANLKKRDVKKSGTDTKSKSKAGPSGPNNNSITLSGLLNFTDGLWSSCRPERIFVFTTNHIEKLDPALLRSGRMDMHVLMGYCSFPAVKILLKNYLDCDDGDIESEVLEDLAVLIDEAEMTPADISEVLIKNKRDKDKAVKALLEALESKVEKKRTKEKEKEQKKGDLDNPKKVGGAATSDGDGVDVELKKDGADEKVNEILLIN